MEQRIIDHFRTLERNLCEQFPSACTEAKALAKGIADPRTATADEIWTHTWNKPLFSNTRVQTGLRWQEKLTSHMVNAWRHWGRGEGVVCISRVGPGRAADAFRITQEAQIVRDQTGIPMWRLFAIQGAATALRERAERSATPYSDLVDADPGDVVSILKGELGDYWGHITVLHLLTDLGLACKPDLHLVRTVRRLGLVPGLVDRAVPSQNQAAEVNRVVRCLVEQLYGRFTPEKLRYVDKILMEISRKKLVGKPY